ncbi:ras guanine nucleotide exchange factor Y [Octopus sinensis]|uniref:Ras guanine nucleotide exchange factor Y n=1 Tax=Octopus sinensis TaxID=2607531 RepID=A0A6P7SPJ9_9MOLL|nr:ras guanine nucleotide exchange factor Y [Octopus sinensis]
MDMDGNTSDHSLPSSDHTGGTWIQSWEKDIHSVSRLNLESNNELNGLVEDKEIAARAVALVVNSSRKGIVPLCADVANLLRAKKSLEKDILLLKQQNNVLHSSSASMHTSHSTSPTPTSLNSYQDGSTLNDPNAQERSRPCSRCSQSSSVLSNSPKTDKLRGHKLSGYSYSPNHNNNNHNNNNNNNNNNSSNDVHSITPVINKLADSPTSPSRFRASKYATTQPNSSTEPSPKTLHNGIITQAIIHHPPDSRPNSTDLPPESPTSLCDVPADVCSLTESSSSDRPSEELTDDGHKRKDSLPEIVSKPIPHLPKSNATVSKEVQCLLSPSIEDEDNYSQSSQKLAENLAEALQEIEILKRKIKELETNQLSSQPAEQPSFITSPPPAAVQIVQPIPSMSVPIKDSQEEPDVMIVKGRVKEQVKIFGRQCSPLQSQQDLTSTPSLVNGSRKVCPAVPKKPVRNPFACPLPLCKCESCMQAVATAGSDGRLPTTDQLIRSYPVSPTLHVRLNDHIMVRGNRTGHIRYIGHLDKMDSANTVFIGLELDAPVGVNDGFFSGKRYFECLKDYGMFVTFNEVVCLVKKVSSIKQALGMSVPSKEASEPLCNSGADILDQFSCRKTRVKNDSNEVEIEEQVALLSESIRL